MTIATSVVNSIMCLEDIVRTRWIQRTLILCPDEEQCKHAKRILMSLDYMVEAILQDDVYSERGAYYSSIDRLRKGLSKVLVTTPEVMTIIQKNIETRITFDVIL